jgi:hypothetical protein
MEIEGIGEDDAEDEDDGNDDVEDDHHDTVSKLANLYAFVSTSS